MMIEELSICGYCCTGSAEIARQPTSTSTTLTTIARTGCLMKMSVMERMASTAAARESRRLACHRDEHGVTQLERARHRNLLAGLQPFLDHDVIAKHLARNDGAHVRASLALRVGREHEHMIAARSFAHGADRHG